MMPFGPLLRWHANRYLHKYVFSIILRPVLGNFRRWGVTEAFPDSASDALCFWTLITIYIFINLTHNFINPFNQRMRIVQG